MRVLEIDRDRETAKEMEKYSGIVVERQRDKDRERQRRDREKK